MRLLFTVSFVFLTFFAKSQKFDFNYIRDYNIILKQTKDPKHKLYYKKLLPRFQANDTSLTDFEVLALMIGYTSDTNFHAYSDISIEREIYKLNAEGKFEKAKEKGNDFYKTHPVNQMTLIELSFAYYKLKIQDSADFFSYKYRRIMDAMALSGKVNSPDSAFFSLTPIDGQNFIKKYLGAKIGTMGSGSDSKGNFLDILGYVGKDNKKEDEILFYFNIQHAMKEMDQQLDEAIKKKK